ncbi:facilitated trehalose transporter Tret1-like [Epargyreus clarus]|uniref:facilitated trehalose transporter Tret1-like n=1 Tax=Epargyreus clarus TaxID=520877 RepID=UPI003C2D7F7F
MLQERKVSPFLKQCFVTAAVCINVIGHGSAIGFPAILLPQLTKPDSGFQLTKEEESWIASIFALCMLAGNFFMAPLSDRLGRKGAHLSLTVPYIVGWFVTILASNVKLLIIGRIILGISGGILNTLRSVLIGEYTSPKNRGAFLTTISLTQAFGICFVHLVGSIFSWQITALICAFFHFISLLMTIYAPESPSWLAEKGRYEECKTVFRWLRGDVEEAELEEMIEARIEMEKEKIQNSKINDTRLKNAMATVVKKEFYKPIIIVIHINLIMHVSGGTTMAAYSTVILGMIMGPEASVNFWMVFLDIQRIFTNISAVYIINKIKRRTMLFSTGALSVLSHLAIATYVYGKIQGWMPFEGIWLPVLLINMQFFTVGMAMTPMPNIIGGEIFPLEYRSTGGTISMAVAGATMFLVLKSFPSLIGAINLPGTYFLFASIITYNLVVIWFLLPETKGRTLQQIEDEFRGRPLRAHEIEARESLHSSIVEVYKRKMSERKCSVFE